jgi:SIT4-associating protein SAP185/190
MPTLLSFLGPGHSWATQTSAGDFIKAIITVSANASQNEQACIGPNELTRQLVSKDCVETLIGYMLGGGNALTVGVGIIIEVIRKNNSDYDPEVGTDSTTLPSSRDPIYLGTLLRLFAQHVPDFMNLILHAPAQRQRLDSTFGDKIEPLGFDRFKTCELMAELLHCSNMALLNEPGSEELVALRDEERRRLRAEGKLAVNRGEEVQSSEDLTMRTRHSSPDDGRRLGITNASDDDGFEEVTPLGEMTEDTSHEFVKAEEEIHGSPATSFLDKDDDDFVDEPLSSPRLKVQDGKVNEQQFENPELMVAPLSPKKPLVAPAETQSDAASSSADTKPSALASTPAEGLEPPKKNDSAEVGHPDSAADAKKSTTEAADQHSAEVAKQAPIPSADGSSEEEHVASHSSSDTAIPSDASTDADGSTTTLKEASPQPGEPDETPADASTNDPSVVVAPGTGPAPVGPDGQPAQPVVGDYLKMQFVEHRVVPTILVSTRLPIFVQLLDTPDGTN